METGNITNTMNVSHNNVTNDNAGDVHIAGSRALLVYTIVSTVWIGVFFWISFLVTDCYFNNKRKRISPNRTETIKYMNVKKRAKTIARIWSFMNFVILWLNISLLIYCHSGSRNCVLCYGTESETYTRSTLIICAVFTYLIQLIMNNWHGESRKDPIKTLHEHLLQLIYWQKPIIKWKATCFHIIGEDDSFEFVDTHTEVFSSCSTKI